MLLDFPKPTIALISTILGVSQYTEAPGLYNGMLLGCLQPQFGAKPFVCGELRHLCFDLKSAALLNPADSEGGLTIQLSKFTTKKPFPH